MNSRSEFREGDLLTHCGDTDQLMYLLLGFKGAPSPTGMVWSAVLGRWSELYGCIVTKDVELKELDAFYDRHELPNEEV